MDLMDLRKRIDETDSKIIPLLMERMGISKEVAEYKVKNGMPVLNEKREQEILENVRNAAIRGTQLQLCLLQQWMLPVSCSTGLSAAVMHFADRYIAL